MHRLKTDCPSVPTVPYFVFTDWETVGYLKADMDGFMKLWINRGWAGMVHAPIHHTDCHLTCR